ncbi:MAG: imidazole glycerol phosphate synthase, glutamine amidotransferase subunit [Candidatus Altiarchaeales archaeon IMC4]|nr:MAG: imidazole glycerol phosphate synthase, glutamine amidotransferase subunit [Candidatus Altiarchaeales archaeon IMC4]
MIAIIDYGAGNLRSIDNALRFLNIGHVLSEDPSGLDNASAILLPGVGNFDDAAKALEKFKQPVIEKIDEGVPFLGICLGIQMLMEKSEESAGAAGWGIVKGECLKFKNVKVPHMGWNSIKCKSQKSRCKILDGLSGEFFYFVHSYYVAPEDAGVVAATCEYGVEFPSAIAKDNVFAVQFHPEKSGAAGLRLLKNFALLQ